MHNSSFATAISHPRFARYFAACENNLDKALDLYRANIFLSQEMYAIIGIFEVALRNCIDQYFRKKINEDWLINSVSEKGVFYNAAGCERSFRRVQEVMESLGEEYNRDKLIAQLSFGFWKYLFSKHQYAATGNCLINAFPNRPFGTSQKLIYQNLVAIVKLRNRIAHHEPICFINKTSTISTAFVKRHYNLILQMLHWLGYNPKELLHQIDNVQKAIHAIEILKENRLKRFVDYILANPLQPYTGTPEYSDYSGRTR